MAAVPSEGFSGTAQFLSEREASAQFSAGWTRDLACTLTFCHLTVSLGTHKHRL